MNGLKSYFGQSSVLYHFISLVGLMMLGIGYMETGSILRLAKNGVSTSASISWVEHVISSSSYTPDIQYHISYFAKNPDADTNKIFTEKMYFGRLLHLKGKELKEGDTIQITYNPQNPEDIQFTITLKEHLAMVRVWGVWVMGLCLLIGGQWLWILALKKPENER